MTRVALLVTLVALGATPALAQSSFDGVYRAPSGGSSGNARCGTTKFGYPLRVQAGMASLHTNTMGDFEGKVDPDGSINIQMGSSSLVGKISGPHFVGNLTQRSCSFDLQYSK